MKQVENYLKVTGKLEFRVLYTADETIPEPASLEGRIPFEEMIYLEQEPDGNLVLKTADVDLTVTVIHSKKTEYQDTCRDYDRNGKMCGRRAHNRYRRRKSCI